MPVTEAVPARTVRRLLCSLQAPSSSRARSSPATVAALVRKLGYVQIDSINVIDRAHHLILGARLEGFEPRHLAHSLERSRKLFEHWTHDACVIPTEWYPHWHHRFRRYASKDRTNAWWRERFGGNPSRVMRGVLERIRSDGALRARDFLPPGRTRSEPGGWWNWHPEKAALEHLWRR
ncbi:MAG: winged helix-turn-helix domain-containing protein, partial [Phycisphaerae bacterium]|nr:winged helix-turn-helix domain-containing protein [Phycisphaerae bacterium]